MIDSRVNSAKNIILIFLFSNFISYAYAAFLGIYNGPDFGGQAVNLSQQELFLVFLFNSLPYFILFSIYKKFERYKLINASIYINNDIIFICAFLLLIFNILITLFWGIGIMGTEVIGVAPEFISPFIQVLNRLNPIYFAVLFLLSFNGRPYKYILIITLMLILGLSRAGIGVILYVLLTLFVRYNNIIKYYCKRNKLLLLFIIFIFIYLSGYFYELRDIMRDVQGEPLSFGEIFINKIIGRLSSFTNFAQIIENYNLIIKSYSFDNFYYIKHMLAIFFGNSYVPEILPERLLLGLNGNNYLMNSSYMTSLFGNLFISYQLNPYISLINFILYIFVLVLCFILSSFLKSDYRFSYVLLLAIYPLTSGSALELSTVLVSIFGAIILLRFLNLFRF
jgi:hypothetical protein